MRMLGAAIVLGLVFVLPSAARGQDDPASAAADTEKTHQQIRQLRDGLLEAIKKKDADSVISFLDEDIVITTQDGNELRSVQKKSGVRDYIERLLTGPNAALKVLDLNVKVEELTTLYNNGEAGVAWGSSSDHYEMADGNTFDLPTRWTATVVKDGDNWKLAALHVSSNLFDNPVLAAAKRVLYQVGAVALLVGLLIGIILGRVTTMSRKRLP